MKVLHICTVDEGGAALCCLRLHQTLLKQGVESRVLFKKKSANIPGVYQYKETFKEFFIRLVSKFLRLLRIQVTERNKVYYLSKKYKKAYTLPVSSCDVSKNELVKWADIIHLHWIDDFVDQPSFFKKVCKPIIWTLHDEALFYGIAHYSNQVLKNNFLEEKYAEIKRNSLRNVDKLCLVMLSNYYYDKFEDNELLKTHLVKVINNPVDTNVFFSIPYLEARKKYNFAPDDIVFAFTAMDICDERKGLLVLSDVLYSINPNIKIMAIGSNSNNLCRPNVISIGKLENPGEIREVLSASNYYALPSSQEAFAQSPMEAMACGLPVVAFPVSGTKELINEDNGVICNDFTKESLKAGILKLLCKQYEADKIRQDMIDRFSPEMIARKYISLYNELIEHY